MIIGDLEISEEEFIKHLDKSIDNKTVDKALANAGLLPIKKEEKEEKHGTRSRRGRIYGNDSFNISRR